jgi:aryl-alcohol dehydrogenase-like predicted oxidoreductase
MQTRNVGASDLQVSLVGLGCNNFGRRLDLTGSRAVIDATVDAGITLFDTADVYGADGASETYLGAILGPRRGSVVLATKFGHPMERQASFGGALRRLSQIGRPWHGASRAYILRAVEGSLRRLKTDWIDLYQLHTPDPETPIEETLRALDDLIHSGKVRYIGASNLGPEGLAFAQYAARELGVRHFICSQDEYSLLRRDAETALLPMLRENHLGLLPFAPLANGLLSGKYRPGLPAPAGTRLAGNAELATRYLADRAVATTVRLEAFAAERGRTLLQLAFSWLVAEPAVSSVIAGASTPEQVRQNAVAADWSLSTEELAACREIVTAGE